MSDPAATTAAQEALEAARLAPAPKPVDPDALGNLTKALSPAARAPAARQVALADVFSYPVALKLAFLGAGQGGGRMAQSFWQHGYRRVAAFNTTASDFADLAKEMPKLSLEVGGAAKDTVLALQHTKARRSEVYELLTRAWGNEAELAMICVGLGGGSGSGACVQLVEEARRFMTDKGKEPRVGAIVSLPTVSEGQQVCKNAVLAFRDLLRAKVAPLIVIDNAKIHQIYTPAIKQLYSTANDTVSIFLHLFNRLAARTNGQITFDQSELRQLLDSGIVVMGAAAFAMEDIKSPADITARIREELNKNVLAAVDLRTSRKAACVFLGNPAVLSVFSLDYFEAGFTYLDQIVGSAYPPGTPTVIHRGLYETTDEGLQCLTMFADLAPPHEQLAALARKGVVGQAANSQSMAAFLGVKD